MFLNWLSQVFSIARFGLMSIPQRRGTVGATLIGIAGVVAVLVGTLSISRGIGRALRTSATPRDCLVLRAGSENEMASYFTREQMRVIGDAPEVAMEGKQTLAAGELFVVLSLPKRSTGTDANIVLRGVAPASFAIRGNVKIVQGRMFEPGHNEVIVGIGASQEFSGTAVGSTIKIAGRPWPIVGVFAAGGTVADSEVWTDAAVMQSAFDRGDSFQSIYVRLKSSDSFGAFKDGLTANPQLNVKVLRLSDYYSAQSDSISRLITTLGIIISALMGAGAVCGALNTMYGAVATRTREIATLRALGFGRDAIVIALMFESVVLAVVGGVVGAALAYAVFNNWHASTMNWRSFSQVTFAFAVTPTLIVDGILWAAAIGFIGGIWPAVRAARLPMAVGLRAL